MKCNQCNRKVKDAFQSKWKHMIRYHPEIVAQRVFPLLINPDETFRLGQVIGKYVQNQITKTP